MDRIKQFEPLFGEWYVESFIGAGSFGRVYKIYREEFGERFYSALKYISIPAESGEVMQLRMDGMDDRSISTYYTELTKGISAETRLMNKLRGNTNIVSFEDSKVIPKTGGMGYDIFIRMELLTGLPSRMVSSPLSTDEVVKLGTDICNALIICKQHGIIHRDIKPDNIFISDTGDFKLGDFGIARQLEKTATFMSKKGTYNYMAPEVYKGEKYGATCDLYSLGIVMYRLLNKGRLPFMPPLPQVITPEDRENAIVRRMKGGPIPAPCGADADLAAIVLKACAFDPKDRFATAKEMKEALVGYSSGEHGIVPAVPVFGFDRANDGTDETQGVFGKSGDSQVTGETDPDATSGVFSNSVKSAGKPETEDNSDKTHGAFAGAAVPPVVEPSKPMSDEKNTKPESDPVKTGSEDKPAKKLPWWIVGIAAALALAIGLMADLGVFREKRSDLPTAASVSVDDIITFGHYEQENISANGKEAIEWRVLKVKNGKALIISVYGLDTKPYNTEFTSVTWETCTLRNWLNGSFYNSAFDSSEKERIRLTAVDNNTQDRIFLLSIDEANRYFGSDYGRRCIPTAYAKANGCGVGSNGCCRWWLRSPSGNSNYAACVNYDGSIAEYGSAVFAEIAVRPALWIDLGS